MIYIEKNRSSFYVIVAPYRKKTDGMTKSRQTLDSCVRCPLEQCIFSGEKKSDDDDDKVLSLDPV